MCTKLSHAPDDGRVLIFGASWGALLTDVMDSLSVFDMDPCAAFRPFMGPVCMFLGLFDGDDFMFINPSVTASWGRRAIGTALSDHNSRPTSRPISTVSTKLNV